MGPPDLEFAKGQGLVNPEPRFNNTSLRPPCKQSKSKASSNTQAKGLCKPPSLKTS